jgi:hypothetical protein
LNHLLLGSAQVLFLEGSGKWNEKQVMEEEMNQERCLNTRYASTFATCLAQGINVTNNSRFLRLGYLYPWVLPLQVPISGVGSGCSIQKKGIQ